MVGNHFDFPAFGISGLFRKFESGIYCQQRDYNRSRSKTYYFRFDWFGNYAFCRNREVRTYRKTQFHSAFGNDWIVVNYDVHRTKNRRCECLTLAQDSGNTDFLSAVVLRLFDVDDLSLQIFDQENQKRKTTD